MFDLGTRFNALIIRLEDNKLIVECSLDDQVMATLQQPFQSGDTVTITNVKGLVTR